MFSPVIEYLKAVREAPISLSYSPETITRKEGGTCLCRGLALGLTQGLAQLASTPPMDGK